MAKISKKVLTLTLIVAVVLLILGLKIFVDRSSEFSENESQADLPGRAKGNPQAAVKIIEFMDFQCPACAKGYQLLNEYIKKNPDKIYLELRHYPLAMHKHGLLSARFGECAARQQRFWPFMDLLIARQSQWAALDSPVALFEQIAKEAGVDHAELAQCLKDGAVEKEIQSDVEEGKLRGVSSTPTYFVNHEMVVGFKSLQAKLETFLAINILKSPAKP